MRVLAAMVLLGGCHDLPKHAPDASVRDGPIAFPPIDAAVANACSAPSTSNVKTNDGAVFTHLDAGGVLQSGGFASIPMSLSLFVVPIDPLDLDTLGCCQSNESSCCPIDGLIATNSSIDPSSAIRDHAIDITRFDDPSFSLSGTLTISEFVDPFDTPPGHITGSLTATTGSQSVQGTIDNDFCSLLLEVPI